MKKFNKYINMECDGSAAVESIILSPLVFITFMFILYLFFMVLSYISFNNLANTIAQDLNMRQTGYNDVKLAYPYMPHIMVNDIQNGNQTGGSVLFRDSQITVDASENNVLRSAVYAALDKNQVRMLIPFSQIEGITVHTAKTVRPSEGSKMAGNVVTVIIDYQSFMSSFLGAAINLPVIQATGYNVIS